MAMNIKPADYLEARASIDYLSQVFNLELSDETYTFHIYNLAMQLSLISNRPDNAITYMATKDNFLETMESFKDKYWEMVRGTQ